MNKLCFEAKLLSNVEEAMILSSDNPLDFHPKNLSIVPLKI